MLKDATGPGASHPHGLNEPFTPGMRVGGAVYILKRVLGRGASGVVWLARDIKLERDVALKIFPETLLRDPNALERLKTQVQRIVPLTHPHIAGTYGFVKDYKLAAISTEYVEGWPLSALRVDKPGKRFTLEEITPWVRHVSWALQFAHETGVVHGDLRPEHLLLDTQEQIKVTSFVLSDALRGMRGGMTSGATAESLGFMSPQQALGEPASVADDIYALGATIFGLLTGTAPFYKGQILAQICERPAPGINERLSELQLEDPIPLVVEDTVARCLAKKPEERPRTVAAVLGLLERSGMSPVVVAKPNSRPGEQEPEKSTTRGGADLKPESVTEESRADVQDEPDINSPSAQEPGPVFQGPNGPNRRKSLVLTGSLAFAILAVAAFGFILHKHHSSPALPSGSVDASFHPPVPDVEARTVAIQPDKKILLGGRFSHLGADSRRGVARLNPDGTVDPTFDAKVEGDIHAIAVQSDGKILIGGEFARVNGKVRRRFTRLNPDGTLDESFRTGLTLNREVREVLVQPDGKILLSGNFDRVGGKRLSRIARLNADGSIDSGFNPGSGASGVVWAMALQPDGKIVLGGKFESFDGQPCGRIVRLEPDGAIDQNFSVGSGANQEVFAVAVQKDGRIVAGGEFYSFNEIECNRIARLNRDGSLDSSFIAGAGPNTGIRCIALDGSGKILIGGIFTSVSGVARNRIARLNPSGALDATLDPGEGASEVVRWIALQPDGRILLAGGFKNFGGSQDTCIARLAGDALLVSK
jgi:uncharacterized delta-60 repeat protein